mmetsp:Transcript_16545/g.41479  ORF Transcript_16545/g.41479 Transcript_16545/m.41479 type:complete len:206 (+) Transcript_16545:450-1067(+)|eukprot:CAMPEP_0116091496 /NCGR_PEP_ID=MMETSP0327-20121206/7536_1 /TAXON_ID=44447 /ORGANISM="Pseudo-nitzschia delicatissima, Strain B596" /LENGTH=205 /DNA_ID=CAMNT_0003582851 /DNA_START=429 /DNA_END=1046 /DNA_ORIENTATION=+
MQTSTDTNDRISNGNEAESERIWPNLSESEDPRVLDSFPLFGFMVSTENGIDNDDLGVQEDDILPNDIYMGRGRKLQQHPGNIWFRNFIAKRFDNYEKMGKTQKTELIRKVYADIIEHNRKFWGILKDKKKGWTVLDAKSALKKIAYTFRGKRKKEREWVDRKKKEKESTPLSPQASGQQLQPLSQQSQDQLQVQDAETILDTLR